MGAVYEAMDQRLSRVVAIKETLINTDDGRKAFEREASLLANLRHPALPNVMDHFAEGNGQYLVMEFISGDDLAQLLELRQRAFPVADVLRWGDDVLKAVEYLHGHTPPILHRDIKPSNLKLTRAGALFLIDFGLAKGAAGQMPTLLTSRSVKGYTPVYAPLEQIHGAGTDPRSDLYSLGATLYHLVTGVAPVDAPARFTALDEDQPDPLRPADQLNPEVPHAVAEVLTKALAMNRRNRPSSASEMRSLLSNAAQVAADTRPGTSVSAAPFVISPTEPARFSAADTPTVQFFPELPTSVPETKSSGDSSSPRQQTIIEVPGLFQRPQAEQAGAALFPTPQTVSPASPVRKPFPVAKLAIGAFIALLLLIFGTAILAPALIGKLRTSNNANIANVQDSGQANPVATSEPLPSAEPKKTLSGNFDAARAVELIYGNRKPRWKLGAEEIKKFGIPKDIGFKNQNVYTSALLAQPYVESGVQKYLLLTQTVPARYDCHACAPMVGGATFSQVGNDWQLDNETRYVALMGSFGNAPAGKLIKIGPEKYGVVFRDAYMAQGTGGESLILIAEVEGTLRELLRLSEFSGDNSGSGCNEGSEIAGPCWKYSSKVDFQPGTNPDYFDIKVTTSGTKLNDAGEVREVNAVRRYKFTQGHYVDFTGAVPAKR